MNGGNLAQLRITMERERERKMDRMEGGESTIETEKQDRADLIELWFGKSLFQLIHTVLVDEGNKVENFFK